MPVTDRAKRRVIEQRYRAANKERLRATYEAKRADGSLQAYWRKYRAENSEKLRVSDRRKALRRKYGLTPEDVDKMERSQNGECAICRTKEPKGRYGNWHVDHNHKTGKVRGLLCAACNLVIGRFENNEGLLPAMTEYLRIHDVGN